MISYITGKVITTAQQSVTVATGPFGLYIRVADPSLFQIGKEQTVYLHMHWNQEQGPSLFGFTSDLEKIVFLLIIGCSGIGPKIALTILCDLGAQTFLQALQAEDERILSKVTGIGTKKAEQIIVQLKHKVSKLIDSDSMPSQGSTTHWHTLGQALESLNYSRTEISHALNQLKKSSSKNDRTFDQLLRQALSFLSKQP